MGILSKGKETFDLDVPTKRVSADRSGSWMRSGTRASRKNTFDWMASRHLRKIRNHGRKRKESGWSRPDDRTRGRQGIEKKVHAQASCCGAEKSLERAALRVSGHCADMRFDPNSERIQSQGSHQLNVAQYDSLHRLVIYLPLL